MITRLRWLCYLFVEGVEDMRKVWKRVVIVRYINDTKVRRRPGVS